MACLNLIMKETDVSINEMILCKQTGKVGKHIIRDCSRNGFALKQKVKILEKTHECAILRFHSPELKTLIG